MTTPDPAFIVSGDIHLDEFIWRRLKFITGDSSFGFIQTVNRAIKNATPLVLNGDIFDTTTPSPEMVKVFRSMMDKCQAAGVSVYALQGNHDKTVPPWFSSVHDWPVYVGHGEPFAIGALHCVGLDYAIHDDARLAVDSLASKGHIDVLFIHQAVKQALGFDGAWNCDLEWVPDNVRLIVMSDIHKPQIFDVGGRKAAYTGASSPRDIDQVGISTALEVYPDLSFKHIPLDGRRISRRIVSTPAELDECRAWLAATQPVDAALPPLLWLLTKPDMLVQANSMQAEFRQAFIHIVPVPSDLTAADAMHDIAGDTDVSADLGTQLRKITKDDDVIHDFVMRLLTDQEHVADTIRLRYEQHLTQ